MIKRRTLTLTAITLLAAALTPLSALAQAYPSKPIRLIVPFRPVEQPIFWQERCRKSWVKKLGKPWWLRIAQVQAAQLGRMLLLNQ